MTNTIDTRTKQIAADLFAQQRAFEEAQAEAAKDGFRPHYCIHGTNLWTDYDNICGGCEDGTFTQYSSPEQVRAYARDIAEGEKAREARQAKEVEETIERILHISSKTEKVIGEPRIYRNGTAALILMDTKHDEVMAVEIGTDAKPTFYTMS